MVEGRTHRPVIHPEKCRSCEICVQGCPAEVIPEYRQEERSLRGVLYRRKWHPLGPDKQQPLPPCQKSCPIGQDVRGYVALIAREKFKEALELIREVNPLPAVCGFICHHPCEEACLREGVDDPVSIRLLKRFVTEYAGEVGRRRIRRRRPQKVLIIGSGPAGLAAAHDLRLLGYGVTIYETLPVLGGMLAVGIPPFRLPREVLKKEIEGIRQLGVEMKTGCFFSLGGDGASFQKMGFDALFLSTGAHRSMRLNVPGENLRGVLPGVDFLRRVNLGEKVEVGKSVAVVGGGNVAIDVARSVLRLDVKKVDVYYRRSREEMPAIFEEVEDALNEGVKIHFLVSPVRMIERGGAVSGMECIRMKLGSPDASGRRRPIPLEASNFVAHADTVIVAIGQRVDGRALRGLERNRDGTVRIDPGTGATNLKGVFAGGDLVRGPGWAIDAIADGKKGARSIHEHLS